MNRILVTGLALGRDVSACDTCNFDYAWLLENPSLLLWSDQVLLSKTMWETVKRGRVPSASPEESAAVGLMLKLAYDAGAIQEVDVSQAITPPAVADLWRQVGRDFTSFRLANPTGYTGERPPDWDNFNRHNEISIDGFPYCGPRVFAIYAALLLSRLYDAQIVFDPLLLNYLAMKTNMLQGTSKVTTKRHACYAQVLSCMVPNDAVVPPYVFCRNRPKELSCSTCARETSCRSNYLETLRTNVERLLSWRQTDEVHQLKQAVTSAVDTCFAQGLTDSDDVFAELQREQRRINARVKKTFPSVQRFANLVTLCSIPVRHRALIILPSKHGCALLSV